MEKEITDLVYNFLCDLKKKDIMPIQRAKIIRRYLESTGQTERQLAKQLSMPHSTIQDWLRWERITPEQYEGYKQEGATQTDIFNSLRNGVLSDRNVQINKELKKCISKLEFFKIRPPYDKDTKTLIARLRRVLNVIEDQIK